MGRWLSNVVLVLLSGVLVWLIWRAARFSRVEPVVWEQYERARRSVLWLQLTFLLVLVIMAFWYWQGSTVPIGVSTELNLYCWTPSPVGGVSVEIPWFGAVGAVLLSLEGVFSHRGKDWDVSFHAWHIARPVVGAVVGMVGFYLFVAALNATGSELRIPGSERATRATTTTPSQTSATTSTTTTTLAAGDTASPPDTGPGSAAGSVDAGTAERFASTRKCGKSLSGPPPDNQPTSPNQNDFLYFALAFILGYRENSFRELVRRLADTILRPPEGDSGGGGKPKPPPTPPHPPSPAVEAGEPARPPDAFPPSPAGPATTSSPTGEPVAIPGPDVPTAEDVGKPIQGGTELEVGDPEWMDEKDDYDRMWVEGDTP